MTFCSKNRVSGRSTAPILSSSSARVGIDTIIVTGIATNVCCETTAREAAVRDFRVFFLSDGTSTFDMGDVPAAELKRATCATLGFLFAQVLTVGEMIRKLSVATRSPAALRAS